MQKMLERLTDAIGTGELINIVYNGGSQPGKARMILPIKIENDKVRAKCYTSNAVKVFNLDKITLAESDQVSYQGGLDKEKRVYSRVNDPKNIEEAIQPVLKELGSLGLYLKYDNDYGIALFPLSKRGKPKKYPLFYLLYNSESTRPWSVSKANAFSHLGHAMERFMEVVRDNFAENQ